MTIFVKVDNATLYPAFKLFKSYYLSIQSLLILLHWKLSYMSISLTQPKQGSIPFSNILPHQWSYFQLDSYPSHFSLLSSSVVNNLLPSQLCDHFWLSNPWCVLFVVGKFLLTSLLAFLYLSERRKILLGGGLRVIFSLCLYLPIGLLLNILGMSKLLLSPFVLPPLILIITIYFI